MKNLIIKLALLASFTSSAMLAATSLMAADAGSQDVTANAAVKIVQISDPLKNNSIQIGEVLTRNLSIEVNAPYELLKTSLPMKNLIRNGIELSAIKVIAQQTDQKNVYHITLQYQVFANAAKPTVMHLPAENFEFSGAEQSLNVQLPAWGFWFSPLVAEGISNAKENLQPQYKATLLDINRHHTRFWLLLALALSGLLGLIYINADVSHLPFMNGAFAKAQRTLKKLAKRQDGNSQADKASAEKKALLAMHAAFNQTYGQNLFAKDIASFLTAQPKFNRLKTEIEQFFADSNASLFASQAHTQLIQKLLSLSKSLRDCERGV
jgi:mxaA protein